jgi:hypothetical protein
MTDICERVLTTLENTFGPVFRQYYDGDPAAIPEQNLPCVIVELNATKVTQTATGMDDLTHTVTVKVCLNKKDDYGKSASEVTTSKKLRAYAQAEPDAGGFDPKSILGILRTDYTLSGRITNQDAEVRYGTVDRFISNTVTAEAHVVFTAKELVKVTRTYHASNP